MSSYDFDGADQHEECVRISGRVKWFDPGKGYGFIVPDDPSQTGLKDVLLHVTSLRQAGRESALEGSVIVCEVVRRPKGWQVSEIRELDETSAARQEATKSGGSPDAAPPILEATLGKYFVAAGLGSPQGTNTINNYSADLKGLQSDLVDQHITYRTFTTSISLRAAKWSQD